MNLHSTTKCLKHLSHSESAKNARSSNVVKFEFKLRHIPNQIRLPKCRTWGWPLSHDWVKILTHGFSRLEGKTTSAGHDTRNTAVVRRRVISSNPARLCSASVHIKIWSIFPFSNTTDFKNCHLKLVLQAGGQIYTKCGEDIGHSSKFLK